MVEVRGSSAGDDDRRNSKGTNVKRTILQLDSYRLISAFHQKSSFDVLVLLFLGNGELCRKARDGILTYRTSFMVVAICDFAREMGDSSNTLKKIGAESL